MNPPPLPPGWRWISEEDLKRRTAVNWIAVAACFFLGGIIALAIQHLVFR